MTLQFTMHFMVEGSDTDFIHFPNATKIYLKHIFSNKKVENYHSAAPAWCVGVCV